MRRSHGLARRFYWIRPFAAAAAALASEIAFHRNHVRDRQTDKAAVIVTAVEYAVDAICGGAIGRISISTLISVSDPLIMEMI